MSQAEGHRPYLRVTAGPGYDTSTHKEVEVNGNTLSFEGDNASVDLAVRIKDFHGSDSKIQMHKSKAIVMT